MIESELQKVTRQRDELLKALKKAALTYSALKRNSHLICDALQEKGYPWSWLLVEIEKLKFINAAIKKAEKNDKT